MSDLEPVILNASSSSTTASSLSSEEIVKKLRVNITSLKANYMSEDGLQVDYLGIAGSPQFQDYIESCALLTNIHPANFSQNKRKAFFLNVYNSLTVHAMVHQAHCQGTLPQAPKDVPGFWKIHSYNIGGLTYSLDDMEHGVLRANRGHPDPSHPTFAASDPRQCVALSSLDPRIHFALNCGARSCPPIRIYTEDKLDTQLDAATRSFLSQEVTVVREGEVSTVETSRLLLWYGRDFGADDRSILQWVAASLGPEDCVGGELQDCLGRGEVRLVYRDYDWTANSGDGQ